MQSRSTAISMPFYSSWKVLSLMVLTIASVKLRLPSWTWTYLISALTPKAKLQPVRLNQKELKIFLLMMSSLTPQVDGEAIPADHEKSVEDGNRQLEDVHVEDKNEETPSI